MYDHKLGGEREERQRAEQAAVVRRQMAEFERNFRAKLGSCSAQVWAQLFAVHYGDAAAAAASEPPIALARRFRPGGGQT